VKDSISDGPGKICKFSKLIEGDFCVERSGGLWYIGYEVTPCAKGGSTGTACASGCLRGRGWPPSRARGSACRRGCGVLRTGGAAPQSTICKKRVAASSRIELADPRRRGGILRCLYKSAAAASGTSHAVSGERAACELSFAHPTMESAQESLARDEPEYLCLARARG